jgi:hypothetical protein
MILMINTCLGRHSHKAIHPIIHTIDMSFDVHFTYAEHFVISEPPLFFLRLQKAESQ